MKKMIATLGAALMMLGLFGVSQAQATPDPDGPAKKGLCTAYFNGQKKGHDKHGSPGPFAALEDAASDDGTDEDDSEAPGEQSTASDVFEFCDDIIIGGQPEHNGRYDCQEGDPASPRDTDDDGQIECLANDGTGSTGSDHPSGKNKP